MTAARLTPPDTLCSKIRAFVELGEDEGVTAKVLQDNAKTRKTTMGEIMTSSHFILGFLDLRAGLWREMVERQRVIAAGLLPVSGWQGRDEWGYVRGQSFASAYPHFDIEDVWKGDGRLQRGMAGWLGLAFEAMWVL